MKKLISMALALAMVAGMAPVFSVSAADDAPKAPEITIDGKLDDWAGTKTLSVVGSGDFDGKGVTFYGVLTDEGLYLAADAYHGTYKTTEGDWWANTNLEIFINGNGNRDDRYQVYVSSKGMNEKTVPTKSHDMPAVMVTESVEKGAAKYHTVVELFLPMSWGWVEANIIDDTARVGFAWKTIGDQCNNGEASGGNGDEYWVPKGSWPDNPDKTFVTAEGIYTRAEYEAIHPRNPETTEIFGTNSEGWSYLIGQTVDGQVVNPEGWPETVNESWGTASGKFGEDGNGVWENVSKADHGNDPGQVLWISKKFNVTADQIKEGKRLYTSMRFDDDIKVYINGNLVFQDGGWNGGYETYALTFNASDLLKEGENVIAVSVHQHFGGYVFDMSLYTEKLDLYNNLIPSHGLDASVSTAEEFVAYAELVEYANKYNSNITVGATLNITADIDASGVDWKPINRYIGTINANGKTISNITYKTDATSGNYGLIVNNLTNGYNQHGTVNDLTVKDSKIVATSTASGDGFVGGIAGYVDRGRILNSTVEDVTVIGNNVVGGIAGAANYASDDGVIKIENNTVKNSTVIAVGENGVAGGIIGSNGGGEKVSLGNYTVENVGLHGKTTSATIASTGGKTPDVGEDATADEPAKLLSGYIQYKENAEEGKYDARVIIEASEEVLAQYAAAEIVLNFTLADGATKSFEIEETVAYAEVETVDKDGNPDTYTAPEGYGLLGIIISGISYGDAASVAVSVSMDGIEYPVGTVKSLPASVNDIA